MDQVSIHNYCALKQALFSVYPVVVSCNPHLGIFPECATFQTIIEKRIVRITYSVEHAVFYCNSCRI